jgi:methylated-DNA-[protein]-cysteine S-methyltransferase
MNSSTISPHFSAPLSIAEVAPTPLGPIWVAVSPEGLAAVEFSSSREDFIQELQRRFSPRQPIDELASGEEPAFLTAVVEQVSEYLEGKRRDFDFPIDWSVLRPFQEQVLRLTYAIPYGQVNTYGEIAREIGKPRAARAVGRAQATNPMPLVIPCHRVVGTDGKLHGYGGRGGIPTKAWLLKMERGE